MIQSFLICMGMFTKLKLPIVDWDEGKGPSALCFLPMAGLFCAVPIVAAMYLCRAFQLPKLIGGALCLLSAFPVCGFVHFDGYMDTADSLLSARDREEKLRILKDSTVGAFSVIALALMLIVQFAAFAELSAGVIAPLVLLMVPASSRAMAALVLFCFKPLSNRGILAYFHNGEKPVHKLLAALELILLLIGFWLLSGSLTALIAPMAALLAVLLLAMSAQKALGGINGDIVGAGIVIFEAVCYLLLAVI